MNVKNILIVGGYGVVGTKVAHLLRKRHPEVGILLGGRNPEKGRGFATELGNAQSVRIDLMDNDPLSALKGKVDIVLAVVNDIDDHLLLSAVHHKIPYVDITRWTERMRSAILRLAMYDTSQSAVVFASSWMAACPGIVAKGLAETYEEVNRIDINILYANQDDSGPNSVEYMDRLGVPYEVRDSGETKLARPFSEAVKVDFPDVGSYKLYRFDSPDQFTLPLISGAQSVAARIGFDDAFSAPTLSFLVRSGIWSLFSGDRFKNMRHGLLHNPGPGAPHYVRIDMEGARQGKGSEKESWLISDPEGQTHLTATGAIIQLDRLMTSIDSGQDCIGVQVAEAATETTRAKEIMQEEGVVITRIE